MTTQSVSSSMFVFTNVSVQVGFCYIMSNHEININLKVRNIIISTSVYSFYVLLILSYSVSLHINRGNPYLEFCFPFLLAFFFKIMLLYICLGLQTSCSNFVYVCEQSCVHVRRVILQNLIILFPNIIRLVLIYIHINV